MPICVSYKRMDEIVERLKRDLPMPFDSETRQELIAMVFELKRCRKSLEVKKEMIQMSKHEHFPPNPLRIVQKGWGREEIIINSEENGYCGKRMVLFGGKRCSIHYHLTKNETFYCESGHFKLEVWNRSGGVRIINMLSGKSYQIEEGTPHRFTGFAPESIFFEFSTFDDPEDSFRVILGD